jgi:C1A family cysteine protease
MKRNYGWKGIGYPDFRDRKFKTISPRVELPKVVSLICPPVVDQGDLGACVFFALSYAYEAMMVVDDRLPINPSQLFAYYQYRAKYGNVNQDDGAFIRDAIKTYAAGVCLEPYWPYILRNFAVKPTPSAYQDAPGHKILSYYAVNDLEDMLQCMASGFGFVAGLSLFESFESNEVAQTGIISMPKHGESFVGGHAVFVGGGYDLHRRVFKFQNSWGPSWGDNGFGYLPFEYLANPGLCGDCWTVRG